jgi:hypothetical protein
MPCCFPGTKAGHALVTRWNSYRALSCEGEIVSDESLCIALDPHLASGHGRALGKPWVIPCPYDPCLRRTWPRFERFIKQIAKAGPQHRVAKSKEKTAESSARRKKKSVRREIAR